MGRDPTPAEDDAVDGSAETVHASTFDGLLREAAETPAAPPRSNVTPGQTLLGRFEVRRRLGEGGMGVVYEAFDAKTKSRLALKVLTRMDAAGVHRLKKEFRSVADVAHENLVGLHELFADEGGWFFTMDLVEGASFVEHVRSRGEASLRAALAQLAAAVRAIHSAGTVHCDLKPSNVLVTAEGRVVVLDFGLAGAQPRADATQTLEHAVAGTPAYMAPEQTRGEPTTAASDWYAVGVMLYEALTGQLPFDGSIPQILIAKQQRDPVIPAEAARSAPADLVNLCTRLLTRDARLRPTADEICEILRMRDETSAVDVSEPSAVRFVGRERELELLQTAYAMAHEGSPRLVFVRGSSGIGKTCLVERFLAELGNTFVLRGRCYEREAVPFKAFDGLVDALVRKMTRMDAGEAGSLLPRDVHSLTRLFPTFKRLEVVARARTRASAVVEPRELRRRAFNALKELFARIADRHALVLFVDDLQWGDLDSAQLLSTLFGPEDPLQALVVCAFRAAEAESSECVRYLLDPAREALRDVCEIVDVKELSDSDSAKLARSLARGLEQDAMDAIVQESEGNPYFVSVLAQTESRDGRAELAPSARSLQRVLMASVESLPADARALLEVVAVSGRPVRSTIAMAAARVDPSLRKPVGLLVSRNLVRGLQRDDEVLLETYHDQIRQAVVQSLDEPSRRRLHARLAAVLAADDRPDPEFLVDSLSSAGDTPRAAAEAERLARTAHESFAYDLAARLYRRAIEWTDARERRSDLDWLLAQALSDAGRNSEAGWCYLEMAEHAGIDERPRLRRLAAEELALGGHVDEAIGLFDEALAEHGLSIGSPHVGEAFAELMKRGFAFERRSEDEIDPRVLEKVDLLWAVAWGLSHTSPRIVPFIAAHALAALEAGEVVRVARGLAFFCGGLHAIGMADGEARRIFDDLVATTEDPRIAPWKDLLLLMEALWTGKWRTALARSVQVYERLLRERQLKRTASLRVAMFFGRTAVNLADIRTLRQRLLPVLEEARDRGDLFMAAYLGMDATLIHLADDRPDRGRDQLEAVQRVATRTERDWFWAAHQFYLAHVRLYEGDEPELRAGAREIVDIGGVVGNTTARLAPKCLRAAMLVEIAAMSANAAELLDEAERETRAVLDDSMRGWDERALAVRAGAAFVRGDGDEALNLLRKVADLSAGPEGNRVLGACAQRIIGRLIGGDNGQRDVQEADAFIRAQGIKSPERWTRMYLPGFGVLRAGEPTNV